MPEYMSENLQARHQPDGEIHPGETVEEKISLSERFGLWLSFHPFKQDDYLDIVRHWLRELDCPAEQIAAIRCDALQWALDRGARAGRVAYQCARDGAARRVCAHHRCRRGRHAAPRRPAVAWAAPRRQTLGVLVGTARRQARARRNR